MSGISTSIQLNDMISGPLMHITSAMNMCISEFEQMQAVSNNSFEATNFDTIRNEITSANIEIEQMTNNINDSSNAVNDFKSSTNGMGDDFAHVKGTFVNIASAIYTVQEAIEGMSKVTNLSDTLTGINTRLNMITGDAERTVALQKEIFDSADNTRSTYIATADAVGRLGINARSAFNNTDEVLAFAEQVNKQFVLSGTTAAAAEGAWTQLTQSMGSGVLRGDELNSIFEAAPTILQAVAEYLNKPISSLREMAEEGELTASIVKNALFSVADETNANFNTMPMTFGQAMNSIQNSIIQTMLPTMQNLARGAQLIADNWKNVIPIIIGVAAAISFYALALGAMSLASFIAKVQTLGLYTVLKANPLFWIALLIGVVVAAVYHWIQSVGGLKVAWLIACDLLQTSWGQLKILFFVVVYGILNMIDRLQIGFLNMCVAIANFAGDLKSDFLTTIQDMSNDAIDVINDLIDKLNRIPGVSIDTIAQVTFGSEYAVANEAAKQARNSRNADEIAEIKDNITGRKVGIDLMVDQLNKDHFARQQEINRIQLEKNQANQDDDSSNTLSTISDNTKSIKDSVELTAEDLKYLRDAAETEIVNRFTTAEIKVDFTNYNQVDSNMDLDGISNQLRVLIEEEMQVAAEGVH